MHELSIVYGIVSTVVEFVPSGQQVVKVRLRLGALSGVVEDSLQFGYGIATSGTPLDGSTLEVVNLPVVIHCPQCGADSTLEGVQRFRCTLCGTPSADIRQGRELEIESFEVEESS